LKVTRQCDWRIADLVDPTRPVTLYLVVPPSDISRTKPLIRLILNQLGRRLTEDLAEGADRQRLLLVLDEFPALGRHDFFESALAFMAGYGIKSFLIAQSLNQIEKPGKGLGLLPAPDEGDVFYDIEGDPYFPGGLEYLHGVWFRENGEWEFRAFWAHTREEEGRAAADLLAFLVERMRR